jgi:carbonic anhydrase
MQSLIDHARTYHQQVASCHERFAAVRARAMPQAMFISCSDAHVVPSLITGAAPGDLFELRTAGNVIPPYRMGRLNAETAAVEYAVEVLGVQDLVVCGHTSCSAVRGRTTPWTLRSAPTTRFWLLRTHNWRGISARGEDDPGRRHLIAQVDKLRRYPRVARRLSTGRLHLHGWFYEVDTGTVWNLQSDAGSFGPL